MEEIQELRWVVSLPHTAVPGTNLDTPGASPFWAEEFNLTGIQLASVEPLLGARTWAERRILK